MNEGRIKFEQRVSKYSLDVVKFYSGLDKNPQVQVLGKQLLRSGTSVGANIFEARAASSKRDFINFYHHALKSANESCFWLKLITESGLVKNRLLDILSQESQELANILGASIRTMKAKSQKIF
ncbi:MAG: four helix bundle protein [Patescibacteria group bacterium]